MEKVEIQSTKGNVAAVIHRPKIKTERLAILCPGYLDSKDYDHLLSLANDLANLGYTAVRFDPTGIWESEGDISDYTIIQYLEDVKSIIEYMLRDGSYEKILLGGHSMGGFVSILYATMDPRISTVLAIMPPHTLIRTVNKDKMEKWKEKGFRVSTRDIPNSQEKKEFNVPYFDVKGGKQYDVLNEVKKLQIPLILVAGELDNVIPPEDVKLIYTKANEPKQFIFLERTHHDYRHSIDDVKKINQIILASNYILK